MGLKESKYTPEYLKEIREKDWRTNRIYVEGLLNEIDRLREEISGLYADLLGQEHRLGSQIEILEKENEELKLDNETWKKSFREAQEDRDEYKQELEHLKIRHDNNLSRWQESEKQFVTTREQSLKDQLTLAQNDVSIKHKYRADVLERSVEKLLEENKQLKITINELNSQLIEDMK